MFVFVTAQSEALGGCPEQGAEEHTGGRRRACLSTHGAQRAVSLACLEGPRGEGPHASDCFWAIESPSLDSLEPLLLAP